jgi:hypothetical protein
MREEIAFWGTVAIVAVLAVVVFKIAMAGPLGDVVPGGRRAAGVI